MRYGAGMRLLQIAIVFMVIASNIRWHWTPNPLLAGLVGIGAAFVFTVTPVAIFHKLNRAKAPKSLGRKLTPGSETGAGGRLPYGEPPAALPDRRAQLLRRD